MHGNIAFVLFFSLQTISLAADVSVYNFKQYFYRQRGTVVKPRAVSQHPWQINCLPYDNVLDMYIVITHLPPNVTVQEITFNTAIESIKVEEMFPKVYRVIALIVDPGVNIKLDLLRSEVLCSSLIIAEGFLIKPESTKRITAWDICGGMCLLEVDVTNQCVENTTTVKAVLENVTSPHDIIETTTIKVTTNGTTPPLDTQSENTTTVKAVLENVTSPHDIIETTTIKVTTNGTIHCKLEPHISVQYNCVISYGVGVRPCQEYEPPGTRVTPECKPNYFSYENTLYMTCDKNGDWNRIVTCEPECGRVTPISVKLVAGGNTAQRGELPWYVAIYKKPTRPGQDHKQICGGSIVSTRIVISAAHCFWGTFGAQDASLFAVATAKLYREWDHKEDRDVQKSNLLSINFTEHYLGATTNQQDDIAILTLETPFKYYNYVRRVCLDFTPTFNDLQLQEGALGKVAGFGLTAAEDRTGSPVLKTVSLPYVPIRKCQEVTPESFTENLTGDKICAGYTNGTAALCRGDSGGGLAFPAQDRAVTRYFLRGIASTAPPPSSLHECNTETVITFTSIINHERFIKQFL